MRKTIKEWLSELPEPYRTQALENLDCDNTPVYRMREAIEQAFTWSCSPQGHGYWREIHDLYGTKENDPVNLRDELTAAQAEIAELKAQIKILTKPHVQMPGVKDE